MGWSTLNVAMSGATGQGSFSTEGGILARIRISGDVPGTADITILEDVGDGAAPFTLVTLTNVTVPYDGVLQVAAVSNVGAATGTTVYPVVGGRFIVNVAQGNAGNIKVSFLIV